MSRRSPASAAVRIALVATALPALAACSDDGGAAVDVGRVERATVTEVVEAPASVVARASAAVTAPATGTVASLEVADGRAVTAGQVLLRIDSPAARRALQQARQADAQAAASGTGSVPRLDLTALRGPDRAADEAFAAAQEAARQIPDASLRGQALTRIARAEADHRAARASLARAAEQVGAGLRSLGSLTASLARAQRAQTRAAVAAAQAGVDALTVRAPISGTVVLGGSGGGGSGTPDVSSVLQQLPAGVQAQAQSLLPGGAAGGAAGGGGAGVSAVPAVGVPVSSGAPLLTVTDVSALSLTASVDETDVLLVRPGVVADVELDAVPGVVYPATVRSVDLQPTTSTRGGVSYAVRLALGGGRAGDEAAPTPRPGMSAVARLRVRTAKDALSVPASAVFRDGAKDAVWVVEGGRAHRREVRLGAQGDDRVEVVGGLAGTDSVVVRGADRVTENQQVGP